MKIWVEKINSYLKILKYTIDSRYDVSKLRSPIGGGEKGMASSRSRGNEIVKPSCELK